MAAFKTKTFALRSRITAVQKKQDRSTVEGLLFSA